MPKLVCLGPERYSDSVLHNCFATTNREEYMSKRAYTCLVGLRNDMCNWSTWEFYIGRKTKNITLHMRNYINELPISGRLKI